MPTLEGLDGVVFVYPICAIDGEAEPFVRAGGSSLLSYLGWDPAALRRGNPIQCPALIELEALRQLGCFASDPLLDGWEDYDLWCRIAERDWRGQRVPKSSPVAASRGPRRCCGSLPPGARIRHGGARRAFAGAAGRRVHAAIGAQSPIRRARPSG